jgi:hypothetical protein
MKSNSSIIISLLVIAVLILGYVAYDRRSRTDKAVDAIRDAGRSVQDVVSPRTPAEKLRDGVKDTVNDLKN